MPQFFFHFRQGRDLSADNVGLSFIDVEEAYLEAFRAAREMWGELMRRRQDPRRCSFEVRDVLQRLLFILPFQEVLDSSTVRPAGFSENGFASAITTAKRAKRICEEVSTELNAIQQTLAESRALLLAKV